MIKVKFTIDYGEVVYSRIADLFSDHEEYLRGYSAILDTTEDHGGKRTYECEFEDERDGWDARGQVDECQQQLETSGLEVTMERVSD